MKRFYCRCGQEVFFENSVCFSCGCVLGYVYRQNALVSVIAQYGEWCDPDKQQRYRFCQNRMKYDACNGLVDVNSPQVFCLACQLNRTIPNLSVPGNLERWRKIEQAKRRLIYGLLRLGLPLQYPTRGYVQGLAFDFLEDQRSNPQAEKTFVATGHLNGVITLNVLEADDVARTQQRTLNRERYRTLLGHLRHECGHYYDQLLNQDAAQFTALFGNPQQDYDAALKHYYQHGPRPDWQEHYISAYASAHPYEDWAECFAHYLHVTDTLETAVARGTTDMTDSAEPMAQRIMHWNKLVVVMNELNRSMGLADAYPFTVNEKTLQKLIYIDEAIRRFAGQYQQQQ